MEGTLAHPFYRYFSRVTQVSAIVLLVPLLLWLKIRSVKEFGLEKNSRPARDVAFGVLVAFVPVVLLGAGYFGFDIYKLNSGLEFGKLLRIAGTAIVVACVEEFLFRGVALGLAARAIGRWPAAIGVSFVFAAVHFLKPAKQSDAEIHWWSGFAQIPRIAEATPAPVLLAFGLLSLFVAGMILAMAALRTRSLWLPIGIHAGWIFGQQGIQWLGKLRLKPADELLPWVGPNVVSGAVPTGLVPLFVLLLTGVAVWLYLLYAAAQNSRRSRDAA